MCSGNIIDQARKNVFCKERCSQQLVYEVGKKVGVFEVPKKEKVEDNAECEKEFFSSLGLLVVYQICQAVICCSREEEQTCKCASYFVIKENAEDQKVEVSDTCVPIDGAISPDQKREEQPELPGAEDHGCCGIIGEDVLKDIHELGARGWDFGVVQSPF